jgi:hypothetical protein
MQNIQKRDSARNVMARSPKAEGKRWNDDANIDLDKKAAVRPDMCSVRQQMDDDGSIKSLRWLCFRSSEIRIRRKRTSGGDWQRAGVLTQDKKMNDGLQIQLEEDGCGSASRP